GMGGIRGKGLLSLGEPDVRDTPLTAGIDAFTWKLRFDDFDRSGTGGGTQFTYPVTAWGYTSLWGVPLEEVRVGSSYRLESADISNVSVNATRSIRLEQGSSLISSVPPRLSPHTLDHA